MENSVETTEFIARKDVLRILDISSPTLQKWQREHRLIAYRGTKKNTLVYRRADVEKLLPRPVAA